MIRNMQYGFARDFALATIRLKMCIHSKNGRDESPPLFKIENNLAANFAIVRDIVNASEWVSEKPSRPSTSVKCARWRRLCRILHSHRWQTGKLYLMVCGIIAPKIEQKSERNKREKEKSRCLAFVLSAFFSFLAPFFSAFQFRSGTSIVSVASSNPTAARVWNSGWFFVSVRLLELLLPRRQKQNPI